MANEEDRTDEFVTCPLCRINYLTGHLPKTITLPVFGTGELTHYRCNICGTKIPMSEAKHYGSVPPAGAIKGRLPT